MLVPTGRGHLKSCCPAVARKRVKRATGGWDQTFEMCFSIKIHQFSINFHRFFMFFHRIFIDFN